MTKHTITGHIIGAALISAALLAAAPEETPPPTPAPIAEEAPAPAPSPAPAPQEEVIDVPLPTYSLAPCESDGEDESINCYWDASLQGNGEGVSFIQFNGNIYYIGG